MAAGRGDERGSLYRYRFGSAEFDESQYELRVGGLVAEVERRPLEILCMLLHHVGEVVTKEELREAVWGGRATVDNVLANAVTKLRSALGEENATQLITKSRIGYMLTGPVERIAVGRSFVSAFEFRPGVAVPKRENFILQTLIGQSRGSEVWLAVHRKTGEQRVYKFCLDGERLAALKREAGLFRVLREGLGKRNDFVEIIDWNFESPPFFLECTYGGVDLAQWAVSNNQLQSLSLQQRIGIFLQLADAVAAAHSVGVLHKDLKPSNVLISDTPNGYQVRVTDFGSGRLLELERVAALGITQLGLTMTQGINADSATGTPLYLAPELIAGQAPTLQSDVYALGLMLYQLIVGDLNKPLVPGWERDVDDELLREDISQATDGDRNRRLASVALLAERLRSHEHRQLARMQAMQAAELAQRMQQALQRSRARRPWLIAAIVTLTVGLLISTWQYRNAVTARRSAELEAQRAEALNRFLNDDLLGAADPTTPGSINDPKMREVLAKAAQKLDGKFAESPTTRASIYVTLGQTYLGLSDYANAERYLRRAIELLATGTRSDEALAQAEYQLVKVLIYVSKMPEAKTVLAQADRDAGKRLNQPSRLALLARLTQGYYYDSQSQQDQALASFAAAEQLRAAVAPNDDALLFTVRIQLINSYIAARRFQDAEKLARELTAPAYTIERVGIQHWAKSRLALGEVLSHTPKIQEAIELDQAVVDAVRDKLGAEHFYTGFALSELANVYVDADQIERATAPAKQVYEITRKQLGEHSQDTIAARANLGMLELQSKQLDRAIDDLSAAQKDLAQLFGEQNPQTEFVSFYLATALSNRGQASRAWTLVNTLSAETMADSGEGGSDWSERLQALKGQMLLQQGRKAEALALLQPAIAQMEKDGLQSWILDPFKQALVSAQRP